MADQPSSSHSNSLVPGLRFAPPPPPPPLLSGAVTAPPLPAPALGPHQEGVAQVLRGFVETGRSHAHVHQPAPLPNLVLSPDNQVRQTGTFSRHRRLLLLLLNKGLAAGCLGVATAPPQPPTLARRSWSRSQSPSAGAQCITHHDAFTGAECFTLAGSTPTAGAACPVGSL